MLETKKPVFVFWDDMWNLSVEEIKDPPKKPVEEESEEDC